MSGTFFYLSVFLAAFAFGFPVGPSSLEMLRLSAANRRSQAWMLSIGVASTDAVWALFALRGLLPWLSAGRSGRKGFFFLLAAAITFFLSCQARNELRHQSSKSRTHLGMASKQACFWKGAMLGFCYPLTLGTWIVALAFFRNFGWHIPGGAPWIVLFFAVVFLGYFSYLTVLQFLCRRFQESLSSQARGRWQNAPGWLMMALSIIFMALALVEFFRPG